MTMTADDFRRLALSLQDAIERAHMGHPDFRVNGRIFASLHSQDRFGMVTLTPEEQRIVMKHDPGMFEPSAGAWGRQGCTNVRLAEAEEGPVRAALILAWERISQKPTPKPRAPRPKAVAKPAARKATAKPAARKTVRKSAAKARPRARKSSR
jgi:hypothetical protein